MSSNNFAVESQQIVKKIRQVTYERTLEVLQNVATQTMAFLLNKNSRYYSDVTGNTLNASSIGIYYKGELVGELHGSDFVEEPTRKTLALGEQYDLPYYYDGDDPRSDGKGGRRSPFTGKAGNGGQWGPTIGKWAIHRIHPAKSKTWMVLVVIPLSYASHNEKIVATMQAALDEFGTIIKGFGTIRGKFNDRDTMAFERWKIPGEIDLSKL